MVNKTRRRLCVVGIVGLPNTYGGFEALVENLVRNGLAREFDTTVYCDKSLPRHSTYLEAKQVRLPLHATGWQSVIYDGLAMVLGSLRAEVVLILGTSATFALPLLRAVFPRTRYVVNMAGLEWSRNKWGPLARWLLKRNEYFAAKFANVLVADNQALAEYVISEYGIVPTVIAYGGDQHLSTEPDESFLRDNHLSDGYDLAIARAQPDNNIELILAAYAASPRTLVFISNWQGSTYGANLQARYGTLPNMHLIGPIFDADKLAALRRRCHVYIHGHSAGGTNPSLVEAMSFGLPVLAYDNPFNRRTTGGQARYFVDQLELTEVLNRTPPDEWALIASKLSELARFQYRWDGITDQYVSLLRAPA